MNYILRNVRRSMTGRWFPIAVVATAVTLWLSMGTASWGFFDRLRDVEIYNWAYILDSALNGSLGLLLLPALSALPFGGEVLREVRSGAFRAVLFRTGRGAYVFGQAIACFVSGLMVQFLAIAVLTGVMVASTLLAGGEVFPFEALVGMSERIIERILCGGGWALIGCIAALITETYSAAILAPLCLCYAITMIAARFFPDAAMLTPAQWPEMPLPALISICLALLLVAGVCIHREVQKHV